MTGYAMLMPSPPESFFTVREQTLFFLLSVVMGGAFGVVFDVFRAVRVIFPMLGGKICTAVCDVLFFLICGFGIYMLSMEFAGGEVRGYYAAGALLGAVIYMLTVGNAVMGVIRRVFGGIYGFVRNVYLKYVLTSFRKISENYAQKKVTKL